MMETVELKPAWKAKRDPEHQPVRFLASLWEQRTGTHLTPKELGQLRDIRGNLATSPVLWSSGSLTPSTGRTSASRFGWRPGCTCATVSACWVSAEALQPGAENNGSGAA